MQLSSFLNCSPSVSLSLPSVRRNPSTRPRLFPLSISLGFQSEWLAEIFRAEMSVLSSSQAECAIPPLPENRVVLGCGAVSVDYLATVAAFPKPDDKIRSTSLKVEGGGNTGNALTTAARLGLKPRLISKVANDAQGRNILSELQDDGVDTSYMVVSEEGNSPFTYVIVDNETRTRTCIHAPGYPPLVPNELSRSKLFSALDGSHLVYFDGRLHETALVVAEEATQRKIPILVDAERKREGLDDLLNLATYIVCSEKFPQAWTSASSIPSALISMLLRLPNIKFVIVTLGEKGCIMLERSINDAREAEEVEIGSLLESLMQKADGSSIIPTCISSKTNIRISSDGIGAVSGRLLVGIAEVIPPSEIIDTTGAGDAFIGAVLYETSWPNNLATVPSSLPKIWVVAPLAPMLAPAFPPRFSVHAVSPIHTKIPHAIPPTSFPPLQENCEGIACSDPLTRTPIGSPCGCVLPIKVVIDIGIAPILLFPQMTELEIEVAAGTHLKQSQVRIMGADASIRGQDKTTVTIYLVPLGEKFDRMTVLLIYDCFWQKKVQIRASIFGYYETIFVHYPGLSPSPPSSIVSPAGSLQLPLTVNVPTGRKHKPDTKIIVLVVLSTFLLISLCIGVVLIIILMLKKLGLPRTTGSVVAPSMTKTSGARSMMPSSAVSSTFPSFISTMATYLPSVKAFSLAELEKATDGFSSGRILGEGGFGCVYHGIIEDQNEVAVKLLKRGDENGDHEFIGEVQMLSRLHHRNLVKLIGVCIEEHNHGLVYELVRNGSVESHLHGADRDQRPLNWDARMKIALGAARALAYLHEDSDPCVIHRDFKAGNILLEDDFTPKVSDFGLAREACDRSHHISTRVMGTFGYVAPEYAMTGHLLVKSDVYSYGVVLLELLTGRKPVYMTHTHEPENLVTWARPLLTSLHGLEQLIDPTLRGCCNVDDFARVAAVASMCVHGETSQRPFMGEVVQALKLVYTDMDNINEDSYSRRGSPPCRNRGGKDDFVIESSWWSDGSPRPNYDNDYCIATMENTSDLNEEIQRPHSTSSLVRHAGNITRYNRSVPLRSKRKKMTSLYRLRGTMSDHGIARR